MNTPRPGVLPCCHCSRRVANASRRLCRRCYMRPDVRGLYPARTKGRGPAEARQAAPAPAEPTDALPGSPEKVAVLRRRAESGEALWHPLDAACPSGGGGWHSAVSRLRVRVPLL